MTPNEAVESAAQTTEAASAEATTTHVHDDHAGHDHSQTPSLNPELTREVAVEVPAEIVTKTYSKIVKRYQKMARIPGFRAGKVPESLIRGRFAKDLRQEVMDTLVQEKFRAEMEAQGLLPISQPQIIELNLHDEQPLRFRAQFEVAPEINVDGYETVTVDKPAVQLEDGELDAEIDRVLESHATVETVEEDRPLVDGDWAEISFKGIKRPLVQTVGEDGLQNSGEDDNVEGEDVMVEVGGKNTLPAFTQALRGQSKAQELSVQVAYPADFGDVRLAGTTIDYDVTINAIKRKTFPEHDADFAKQLGDFDSWDKFVDSVRESVTARKKNAVESETKSKLVDALVEKFHFPVPESFVQQQIDVRLDRGLRALAQQGMPEEQMRQFDFARLRAAQRDEAVKEVKASLLLDRIAVAANVQVKEEDIEREIMIMSLQSREPLEQLRERMTSDGSVTRIREQMRREATATTLYEKMA